MADEKCLNGTGLRAVIDWIIGKLSGKSDTGHTHAKSDITDMPTSLPANGGNADTATKLATARTIALTGSVTGSGTFDGSGNLSIATTTNHTHSYLPLSGGTMSGSIKFQSSSLPSKELQYICGIDAFADGGEMGWQSKDNFLSNCSKVNHTHNYAGSSSAGGAANSANWLNTNNSLTYGASGLQYFNQFTSTTSGAKANANPTADWYHIIRMNHADNNGYFVDLATCFHSDRMYYRRIAAGVENSWVRILDSNNYKSYCTPSNIGAAASSHTHSYAGSSSAGGSATSAVKLDSSAGSATQPVYFSGGKPVACSYTFADLVQIIDCPDGTDSKTCVGISGKTTIYRCVGSTAFTDVPDSYTRQGTIIAINFSGGGTAGSNVMWVKQIFVSAHAQTYVRYIDGSGVGSWCRDVIDIVIGTSSAQIAYKTGYTKALIELWKTLVGTGATASTCSSTVYDSVLVTDLSSSMTAVNGKSISSGPDFSFAYSISTGGAITPSGNFSKYRITYFN